MLGVTESFAKFYAVRVGELYLRTVCETKIVVILRSYYRVLFSFYGGGNLNVNIIKATFVTR